LEDTTDLVHDAGEGEKKKPSIADAVQARREGF
jgi:hypothetical protein